MDGLREKWETHAAHKRTIDKDKQRLKVIVEHFGKNRLIATLTSEDIEAFRDKLSVTETRRKKKMKPATVNRYLAVLRAALRHVAPNYFHRDPMRGVKFLAERNKRERECETAEYEALLKEAEGDLRLAIVLAYEAGLRRNEIGSATRAQVSKKRREIHIPADKSKNDTGRTVPLTKRALEELKAAVAHTNGQLVVISLDDLSHGFADLCKDLKINGLHFHDLRGTAITRLARAGASLDELKAFSGHKSVQALMKYLKRGDRRLRQLVDAMEAEGRDG